MCFVQDKTQTMKDRRNNSVLFTSFPHNLIMEGEEENELSNVLLTGMDKAECDTTSETASNVLSHRSSGFSAVSLTERRSYTSDIFLIGFVWGSAFFYFFFAWREF